MRPCLLGPDGGPGPLEPTLAADEDAPWRSDLVQDLGLDALIAAAGDRPAAAEAPRSGPGTRPSSTTRATRARSPRHPDRAPDRALDDAAGAAFREILLAPPGGTALALYRADVLADFQAHPELREELEQLATRTISTARQAGMAASGLIERPAAVGREAVSVLRAVLPFLDAFAEVGRIRADGPARSAGLTNLHARLREVLDRERLGAVDHALARLDSLEEIRALAGIGRDGRLGAWRLAAPDERPGRHWRRPRRTEERTVVLADRDEAGAATLAELADRAILDTARLLESAARGVVAFAEALAAELAVYRAAARLSDALAAHGSPTCRAEPADDGDALRAVGLYDPGLALRARRPPVGNDLMATRARLVLVTGANQGGKSTFLRALGCAQLLASAGFPVPAAHYSAPLTGAVWTHFPRAEDRSGRHGRLDHELRRLADLVARMGPGDLLLLNESFASTDEEGAGALAREVIPPLCEAGIRVVFVTHFADVARSLADDPQLDEVVALAAERRADGERTFRLRPGLPEPTSHGADLWRRIMGPGT